MALYVPYGNTLFSLRNFNFGYEVDPQGSVVKTLGKEVLVGQHDPEILPNGNILAASHGRPPRAAEIDSKMGEIV